jgi:hypothetical protein
MQRDVNAMIINATAADYKCAWPVEWLCELATFVGLMNNLLPPRQCREKKKGKNRKKGAFIVCLKRLFQHFFLISQARKIIFNASSCNQHGIMGQARAFTHSPVSALTQCRPSDRPTD